MYNNTYKDIYGVKKMGKCSPLKVVELRPTDKGIFHHRFISSRIEKRKGVAYA